MTQLQKHIFLKQEECNFIKQVFVTVHIVCLEFVQHMHFIAFPKTLNFINNTFLHLPIQLCEGSKNLSTPVNVFLKSVIGEIKRYF